MSDYIQELKIILQREEDCETDDEIMLRDAEEKLHRILQEYSDDEKNVIVCEFVNATDIQKRKLLSYCIDFSDPTFALQQLEETGEQCQHKFLQDDDLVKLYKFVKRHSADKSFGDTVYKVMDKHGMSPPEVYKNALLRRQDFSRVTNFRAKNVTRQLAWQIIIGLHCSLEEADEVLFSAGFIRGNSRLDLTMEFFIKHENYDIMAINEVLDELGIKPFSCYKPVKDKDNK